MKHRKHFPGIIKQSQKNREGIDIIFLQNALLQHRLLKTLEYYHYLRHTYLLFSAGLKMLLHHRKTAVMGWFYLFSTFFGSNSIS
jgi:hypothetical protein